MVPYYNNLLTPGVCSGPPFVQHGALICVRYVFEAARLVTLLSALILSRIFLLVIPLVAQYTAARYWYCWQDLPASDSGV